MLRNFVHLIDGSLVGGRHILPIGVLAFGALMTIAAAERAHAADDAIVTKAPAIPFVGPAYNWNGFYAGGRVGYAFGSSNWTASSPGAPNVSGSIDLFQPLNAFNDTGSFTQGLQAGYNYMLPNRIVIGAEADVTFPAFPDSNGISIGGTSNLASPLLGPETYSETVFASGTVRGRVGYAPGSWLFYATGGFAWTYDRLTITQLATGMTEQPFLWRLGWAAGAGVEAPVAPHWTARLEYLFTDYGNSGTTFFAGAQRFDSDFMLHEIRAGLNYQFGNDVLPANAAPMVTKTPALPDPDRVNFHGQMTFLEQAYPAFRSPYQGPNSLPGGGQGRETADATLYAGVRLWKGAELWINPELDQGFGIANTLGVAGFTSGEAYKVGQTYPYARLPRAFIRQTIDLSGEMQKVDAGINQFAGSQAANRLVLTVGRFSVVDIFDTNKYAHDPRSDFMNWAVVDTATFDYAADPWGYTYGAAAEWYQGNWAFRGGLFDLSIVPNNVELDPTFAEFQWVGEIERRYNLWGRPGKIVVTGFLSRGGMGSFANAIALAAITGGPADIAAVRQYQSRGGVSMNIEQEITSDLGAFIRAGWADGNIEPYEFTDVDRTVSGGLSLNGKQWGRPDDTVGLAGVVNGITSVHQAFLNAGGLGILIGDGQLPHPGLEQIIETYYSYALTAATRVSVDYQLVVNPGYNTDRGPVNVFAGRFHAAF
jgi:high affinity Mn2+ porin